MGPSAGRGSLASSSFSRCSSLCRGGCPGADSTKVDMRSSPIQAEKPERRVVWGRRTAGRVLACGLETSGGRGVQGAIGVPLRGGRCACPAFGWIALVSDCGTAGSKCDQNVTNRILRPRQHRRNVETSTGTV